MLRTQNDRQMLEQIQKLERMIKQNQKNKTKKFWENNKVLQSYIYNPDNLEVVEKFFITVLTYVDSIGEIGTTIVKDIWNNSKLLQSHVKGLEGADVLIFLKKILVARQISIIELVLKSISVNLTNHITSLPSDEQKAYINHILSQIKIDKWRDIIITTTISDINLLREMKTKIEDEIKVEMDELKATKINILAEAIDAISKKKNENLPQSNQTPQTKILTTSLTEMEQEMGDCVLTSELEKLYRSEENVLDMDDFLNAIKKTTSESSMERDQKIEDPNEGSKNLSLEKIKPSDQINENGKRPHEEEFPNTTSKVLHTFNTPNASTLQYSKQSKPSTLTNVIQPMLSEEEENISQTICLEEALKESDVEKINELWDQNSSLQNYLCTLSAEEVGAIFKLAIQLKCESIYTLLWMKNSNLNQMRSKKLCELGSKTVPRTRF